MNTKFIGVKDFRQNMADYAKKARSKSSRYIVVSHNVPLFELKPFDEDETLESFFDEIMKAKAEVEAGRVFTHDEVVSGLQARLK